MILKKRGCQYWFDVNVDDGQSSAINTDQTEHEKLDIEYQMLNFKYETPIHLLKNVKYKLFWNKKMLNVDDGLDTSQSPGHREATFPTLGTHSTILAGRQEDNLSNLFFWNYSFEFILQILFLHTNLFFQQLNLKPTQPF